MTERALRLAAPSALLILALCRLAVGDPFGDPPSAPEGASAEAIAVLDGLAVGDEIAGLEVLRITGPFDGKITIELARGDEGIRLFVGRLDSGPAEAPARTADFDVFYGPPSPEPRLRAVSSEVALAAVTALAERIEAGGAGVPESM
jgi:hypothetical protein